MRPGMNRGMGRARGRRRGRAPGPRWRRAAGIGATLTVAGLAAAGEAWGQAPRVTIEADTLEIHVGDPLALRLSVEHAADLSVRWPDSLPLGSFEALTLEVGEPTPAPDGDAVRTPAVLRVTAFELGELEVPSFDLELTDGTERSVTVSTDPVVIGVTTVGLDESGDIRDVKGPRAIARNWLLLWPWALLALALAGLGYWWGRRRRSGPETAPAGPREPDRPPHEIALEALERLAASPLLERGEIKQYHIEVSRIVRAYIEGRYRIWALEMITPDVVSGLGRAGVDPETRTDFQRFLEACDLVKFAKWRPDGGTCRRTLADARELVERTKYVPPPVADDGGDDGSDGGGAPDSDAPNGAESPGGGGTAGATGGDERALAEAAMP